MTTAASLLRPEFENNRPTNSYDFSSSFNKDHRLKGFSDQKNTEPRELRDSYKLPHANDIYHTKVGQADAVDGFFLGLHSTQQRRVTKEGLNALHGKQEKMENSQKINQTTKVVQQFLTDYHQVKTKSKMEEIKEKQRDFELLKSYDPWSKPGGGAPKGNNKLVSSNMATKELERSVTDSFVSQTFGKPGHGAPIRSNSGHLRAKFVDDTEVAISNVSREVPYVPSAILEKERTSPRASPEPYRRALEEQMETKQSLQAMQRERSMMLAKKEMDTVLFGKMGAGAPVLDKEGKVVAKHATTLDAAPRARQDKERSMEYAKILESQCNERDTKRQEERGANSRSNYDPWGKGVGAPERTPEGKLAPRQKMERDANVEGSFTNTMRSNGGGSPRYNDQGNMEAVRTKWNQSPSKSSGGYDPWGKPGAGAPICDNDGNLVTKTVGRAETEVSGLKFDPHRSVELKKTVKNDQESYLQMRENSMKETTKSVQGKEPAQESFFQWGAGGQNPKRDPATGQLVSQKKVVNDVVQMNVDNRGGVGRREKTNQTLNSELSNLADEKRKRDQEHRQYEKEMERNHASNATSWVNKGAGQPRRDPSTGETHGRFGLDSHIHYTEPLESTKSIPPQEKMKYWNDLEGLKQEKSLSKQQAKHTEQKETFEHLEKASNLWGKEGHGAPLRSKSGHIDANHTKRLQRGDEFRMGAKSSMY